MVKIIICFLCVFLSGCTISIIMNHTEGHASDMVDTEQAASPQVDAKADIHP